MLNLNDLSVFVTAAESKSFSEAGRRLHLSQPAISQTIEKLEKEFETRLFLRQGRRVHLSETGQVLLPMARELLAEANRLEESMASLRGEMIGEMVVGCSTASGKYLLPAQIAAFRKAHPQVRIHVLVSGRESVISQLHTGELSLGITSKRLDHRNLEFQDFFVDDVILIVAAEHPWASYRQIFPEDLLDEPMIMREEAAGTRQALLGALRERAITPDMLKIGMVLGNSEAIVMAVEEGIGVAFISRLVAARSLELGRVMEVRVTGMELSRKIYMARNRRIPPTKAQACFWNFVTQAQSGNLISSVTAERQLS